MKKGIIFAISGLLALSVFAVQMPSANADAGQRKTGSACPVMRYHHKHHKTGAACKCHKRYGVKKRTTGAAANVTPKKHKHHYCPKDNSSSAGTQSGQSQSSQPQSGSYK